MSLSVLLVTAGISVYAFETYLEISRILVQKQTRQEIATKQEMAEKMGVPYDTRTTIAVFTLIIVCTAISYFLSPYIIGFSEAKSLYFFQAFVAGSLVHMAAFGSSHDHHSLKKIHFQDGGWAYRVGILLGMFLIFSVPYAH